MTQPNDSSKLSRKLTRAQIGRKNIAVLYTYSGISHLWFDGGLWVVYFQHKGLSLFQVGLLEAVLHLVAVASDVPIGIFADKIGWKRSLGLSTVAGIIYTVLCLSSASIWLFVAAFAARGLQITLTNGSDAAIAYESTVWAGMKDKYLAISGRLFAIGLISMGIAEAVGGSLANWSWSSIYVAFTIANVLSFIAVLFIREPWEARIGANETRLSALTITVEAVRFARRSKAFAKWIVFSTILSGFTATFSFYGQSLLLHAGWSLIGLGVLTGAENGIGAIVSWMTHRIVRRFSEPATMTASGILASIGLLAFAWIPGMLSGAGYLLGSAADNLSYPLIDQGLNRIVPSAQRATLLSAHSTGFSLFMIAGFPLFGAVAQKIGLVHTAYLVSIVGAVCILGVTWWWRRE
ncbi:MFS transporter [Alicyclobacillus sp. SO9]|uniref:MFS transporter n=1 Tax=Alicyclobacillus sp. SO9 TaxID=2665646 RepID=UPI0018E88996|nr:MFS transporter [Alicyclobacillus sp. SO9]QQE77199.1 MFS transporter [Alicyclobacillus sp. SO9]